MDTNLDGIYSIYKNIYGEEFAEIGNKLIKLVTFTFRDKKFSFIGDGYNTWLEWKENSTLVRLEGIDKTKSYSPFVKFDDYTILFYGDTLEDYDVVEV